MGRIYCMMGKSSSGKDTLFRLLLEDEELSLKTVIPYTTRPMRAGEQDGREYFFCTEEKVKELGRQGRIVELRAYNTIDGVWKYFTADDGQINAEADQDYLVIGTLESYLKLREYYGKKRVIPIYIEVEDGERLQRALDRERLQAQPKYGELCRRFLADAADFSEEKLERAEVFPRFKNRERTDTLEQIKRYIREGDCVGYQSK